MREPTIADIKRHNRDAGFFFFSPDTMRFFNSRIGETVYTGPGGVFFTTSEQPTDHRTDEPIGPRRWKVRRYDPETGDIRTHYEGADSNGSHATAAEAHAAARIAARGES